MKLGIIGCGNISDIYLKNLTTVFKNVTVQAVCDIDTAKATAQAQQYHIEGVLTLEQMLADKHVYVEKPLFLSYCEGKELLSIAKEKGLYIGGGPLFDMGPYYITALVRLLGPVKSVYAVGTKAFAERTITSTPKFGQKIPVKVDTYNVGILSFENGAVITLVTSFDVVAHTMPNIELYGTDGSMKVPDPNMFGGSVQLTTRQEQQFTDVPLISRYSENSRGIGISEMILAINENRTNNASGELALHVLEIMEAFLKSAESGAPVFIESVPSPEIALDWNVEIGEFKTRN